jgi:tetratricopeptide (TPR) repeat protein
MWWLAAILLGVLLLLFWPSARRRFLVHARRAEISLARRDWNAFELHLNLAREVASQFRDRNLKTQAEGACATLRAQGAYQRGDFEEAEAELAKATQCVEVAQPPDRAMKLLTLRRLWGDLHFDRGELAKAEEQFRMAVQAVQFEANPAVSIFSLQRLCDVLLEEKDYERALPVAERCVEYERNILYSTPNAGVTAQISMTEPDVALASKDFIRAEKLFQEKADYWSRMATKADNIDVTRYQFHLASAQEAQGKLQEACATLERACERAKRDFGPEHPRAKRAQAKLVLAQAQYSRLASQ